MYLIKKIKGWGRIFLSYEFDLGFIFLPKGEDS